MQFCKEQFTLAERNDKGVSLKEVLLNLQEQLGYEPPELQKYSTELPQGMEQVWVHFLHLHATRSRGMSLCPITFAEIEAYSRLTNSFLSPEEITVIKRLDAACLEELDKQQDARIKKQENKVAKR